ncbi:MAG: 16S rRNA (uracil(1498)-N(3))-methyltransferase [Treponema sp.]|nr:16S rRNA (uracil(1498)-N(3))-methyltransferase [Treponema sp.]
MRQLVACQNLDERGCLVVQEKQYHHLVHVLRVHAGDMIYVRLPSGKLQTMTVARVAAEKREVLLQVAGDCPSANLEHSALHTAHQPSIELWLFQFVPKPAKFEQIVRQAVECGVSVVVPVAGQFCQHSSLTSAHKKAGKTEGRFDRIISEARSQSGSPVATRVHDCINLSEALALWNATNTAEPANAHAECARAIVLYEQSQNTVPLHHALNKAQSVKKAALFVGAEGGISPQELEELKRHGVVPVHFATNILRCETAALYGLAAVQTALMENGLWQYKE